ncbi:MAG: NAD(P)/FAD-dependent oxidoreductase [bacterium]|nr:NAD(P)/FAD-dependent oxidoreductase [Gammaproteobacteria bacterium]HIL97929.1 NAD(P)/FAD-dependent oxidoreductase [Pseudomonadales bacterium]
MASKSGSTQDENPEYDVIIVGAGVCGIYMLHRMLELGVKVTLLETGAGPGGTWYWNRYPGARFDSESYTYGYSFSKEILQEWDWSEHFSGQPETLRYLNYVVDKFELRGHMQFGCRVKAASFDEGLQGWHLETDDGRVLETRFLVTAIGMLSAATMPRIEGVEDFKGESFHTYYWPQQTVSLAGKKVAVVGTGATGVQVISEIADKVGSLTIFQRRPNWCAPLHNGPIDPDTLTRIKSSYDEIFKRCKETPGGFLHGPDRREYSEISEADRLEFWEMLYNSRGFGVWLGNFRDVLVDPAANAEYSEFIAEKIRQRVNDAATAEKLIPRDHGFGTRRVPLETRYYEAYNRDNVHLVDINETPIECVTKQGIRTSEAEYEFDLIIYATGFDAITGAFDRIDFTGAEGQKLRDKWDDGPITLLGLQTAGFPNLVTLAGPQGASVSTNFPPGIEEVVDWTTDLIKYMQLHDYRQVEASAQAEAEWIEHVKSMYDGSLISTTKSWFTGYNSNVDGHDKLRYMVYFGGAPKYRQRLAEVADKDYEGFDFK